MSTIHVKAKFHFTPPTGETVVYNIGTHTNVPKATAEHPFVKAHCTDFPAEDDTKGDNSAVLVLLSERDAQIGELANQVAGLTAELEDAKITIQSTGDANTSLHDKLVDMTTERDALVTERDALVTERDALVTERDALANQVAELQAGGPSTKKKN